MTWINLATASRALICFSALLVPIGGMRAAAADLGGNCCADLEERVAELEATTARKGNRKVSLTISGWINEAVFFWDDGVESNAYVGTNSLEQDRVKFSGEAKIDSDWSAGYTIELGINGAPSNQFTQVGQLASSSTSNFVGTRHAYWFIKSKTWGSVRTGLTGTATYHLLDDADGANTRNYSDAEAASVAIAQFRTRVDGVLSNTWASYLGGFNNRTPGQEGRRNVVRYDSPTILGFTLTTAWGEDDIWDVALTYKREVGDFKLLGKIGYGESTDPVTQGNRCANPGTGDCQWWGAAGTIMHTPTGLYVYSGFGEEHVDGIAAGFDDENSMWFVQAGIEQKWCDLGKTTIFGEFRNDNSGLASTSTTFDGARVTGSDIDFWAAGVVQNVESAAMDLYVIYRHTDGDISTEGGSSTDLDGFDMVISGARIQF
jgi:hypothetical protein